MSERRWVESCVARPLAGGEWARNGCGSAKE